MSLLSLHAKPHSDICRGNVCLAVTCHLHFWQNDWNPFTCYCKGWNGYRNESAQTVAPWKVSSPATPAGTWTHNLLITSSTLYHWTNLLPQVQEFVPRFSNDFSLRALCGVRRIKTVSLLVTGLNILWRVISGWLNAVLSQCTLQNESNICNGNKHWGCDHIATCDVLGMSHHRW